MSKVMHEYRRIDRRDGGFINTTLCGRQSNAGEDVNVATAKGEVVTCKFCIRIRAQRNGMKAYGHKSGASQ